RLVIGPFEERQVVDGEAHEGAVLDDLNAVKAAGRVCDRRQRIRALRHQVKTGGLAQVRGVEGTLVLPPAPEVRRVQGADVTRVVLWVRAVSRGETVVEDTAARHGRGAEEQHRETRLVARRELPRDADPVAEHL